MRKWILASLALLMAAAPLSAQQKPVKKLSNRYGMALKANDDGTYSIAKPGRYVHINLEEIPDVYTYYKAQPIASKEEMSVCTNQEFIYKTHEGYSLKLIIDRPKSNQPTPFVIYIHGGGWTGGAPRGSLQYTSQYLASQCGIAGVRITYSLGGQLGANVEVGMADVRAAVEWVQANAKELNIDPKRFGFYGHSAGAHLAAMAAMTIKGTTAVVGNSGPYVLSDPEVLAVKYANQKRRDYFFGFTPEASAKYSPINCIPKRKIPSTLLLCGTGDTSCEYTHSVRFADALKKKGGRVDLRIYPYYEHNLHSSGSDKGREILLLVADFFSKELKK